MKNTEIKDNLFILVSKCKEWIITSNMEGDFSASIYGKFFPHVFDKNEESFEENISRLKKRYGFIVEFELISFDDFQNELIKNKQ